MTKSVIKQGKKGGRTPQQLLMDYFNGDIHSGALWAEYARNFKGQAQLYWSRGLRAECGLTIEKTDEELAVEQDEIAIILASLSPGAWRIVVANDARAELLAVAGSGDRFAVAAFLRSLGVNQELGD